MKCSESKHLLGSYADGALRGGSMQQVEEHLNECAACKNAYQTLMITRRVVGSLGRKAAPPDLALRLRVAIAREAAAARRPWYEGWLTRFDNTVNAFLVPATAGILSAIIVFGLLIGFFAIPTQLRANDVPTTLYTPPELRIAPSEAYGPFAMSERVSDDAVVVEATVDETGRVQTYKLLSDVGDDVKDLMPQLNNMMLFTRFRPATAFGRPISGKAVISFARVNVRG